MAMRLLKSFKRAYTGRTGGFKRIGNGWDCWKVERTGIYM